MKTENETSLWDLLAVCGVLALISVSLYGFAQGVYYLVQISPMAKRVDNLAEEIEWLRQDNVDRYRWAHPDPYSLDKVGAVTGVIKCEPKGKQSCKTLESGGSK